MTTPAAATTPAEYQAAQSGLASSLATQLAAVWPVLDVAQLADTLPALSQAVAALVHRYGSASAAVASAYYDAARLAAAAKGTYTVVPAQPAGLEQVTKSVSWATKGLWSETPDVAAARTLVTGSAGRLALNTGRDTIVNAVRGDRQARGWARHTEPGACAFCAMLATRGAVYKTERTASFDAHDHDRCTPEPVFGIYEPPAHVREWKALYRQSTRGTSGKESIRAFRAAYDGKYGPAQGESTPHGG